MPIYEYKCDQCGHHLEALQKISEGPLIYCPECGDAALRKQVSAAAFRLKGTGWYETDFKDGGKEKKKEAEKGNADRSAGQASDKEQKSGKETGASSGDTKSDSKTETSSDSKTGPSKSETKPAADSGGSDSTDGANKPSSGASPSSD